MLTIKPRMVSIFGVCNPISFQHMYDAYLVSIFRSMPNHMQLKYRCPDYCYVGLTHVYLKFKPAGAWCCSFTSNFLQLCIQTLFDDTLQFLDALENIEVRGSQHVTKLQVKLTKPSNTNTLYIKDTPWLTKEFDTCSN